MKKKEYKKMNKFQKIMYNIEIIENDLKKNSMQNQKNIYALKEIKKQVIKLNKEAYLEAIGKMQLGIDLEDAGF